MASLRAFSYLSQNCVEFLRRNIGTLLFWCLRFCGFFIYVKELLPPSLGLNEYKNPPCAWKPGLTRCAGMSVLEISCSVLANKPKVFFSKMFSLSKGYLSRRSTQREKYSLNTCWLTKPNNYGRYRHKITYKCWLYSRHHLCMNNVYNTYQRTVHDLQHLPDNIHNCRHYMCTHILFSVDICQEAVDVLLSLYGKYLDRHH